MYRSALRMRWPDMQQALITRILIVLSFPFLAHPVLAQVGFSVGLNKAPRIELKEGDILFQRSNSAQSQAIEKASGSKWTHCGIVFIDEQGPYVIEAVQPVKRTELKAWISRGNGVYEVKRLKDESRLTPEVLRKMEQVAESHLGKDYDPYFLWDDQRIYCSELVWKVYQQGAGIEVGTQERFGDMDLTAPLVQRILKERFGNAYPVDEPVVSPATIHRSVLLRKVK